jgi:hypothetical protein
MYFKKTQFLVSWPIKKAEIDNNNKTMTFKVKDKIAMEFEVFNLLCYCIFTVWPPTFLFFT